MKSKYNYSRLIKIGTPIALGNLGHMLFQLTDLMVVGRISPEAVGGVGTGSAIFSFAMVFGFGILAGIDTHASQAFGRGDHKAAMRVLCNGLILAGVYSLIATAVLLLTALAIVDHLGINKEILPDMTAYLAVLSLSILPLLLFQCCRQYLQAIGHERVGMWVTLVGIVLNLVLDIILVLGWGPIPGFGAVGAAIATLILRVLMAGFIMFWMIKYLGPLVWDWSKKELQSLFRLGLPASLQMSFEIGAFVAATLFVATMDPASIAAHQIVLNIASVTFMIPLGLSAAGAVVVGQSFGANKFAEAKNFGWAAIQLSLMFMSMTAICFFLFPRQLVNIYSSDLSVVQAALTPMIIAAGFQLFDGVQVVGSGILRGLGETRIPAIVNGFGHWVVGLPLGTHLAFNLNWGLVGIWTGLASGLFIVALMLAAVWWWSCRKY